MRKFLLALVLSLTVFAAGSSTPREVRVGGWPDGTGMAYQCQNGAAGKVKFMFVTKEKEQYTGEIDCGTSI